MKKNSSLSMILLLIMVLSVIMSCSKDDDDVKDYNIVIKDDGTTSDGSVFSFIDYKNFYLDYIKYTVEGDYLVVSGYDEKGFKGEAKIASSITYKNNTYKVLEIKRGAFNGCFGLTSVTIPNSVTSIGEYAFEGCLGLTSVTIPNSVVSIGYLAFEGCFGLTSITIPNSVASIGDAAFWNCSGLTSIVVEKGNVEYDSRSNCNAIIETSSNTLIAGCKNTIIPADVTSIGRGAFNGCLGLTSVTIPNSVTSIGGFAFQNCI